MRLYSDALRKHWKSCVARKTLGEEIPAQMPPGRKRQACDSCAALRQGCDSSFPCGNCRARKQACSYRRLIAFTDVVEDHCHENEVFDTSFDFDAAFEDDFASFTSFPECSNLLPFAEYWQQDFASSFFGSPATQSEEMDPLNHRGALIPRTSYHVFQPEQGIQLFDVG